MSSSYDRQKQSIKRTNAAPGTSGPDERVQCQRRPLVAANDRASLPGNAVHKRRIILSATGLLIGGHDHPTVCVPVGQIDLHRGGAAAGTGPVRIILGVKSAVILPFIGREIKSPEVHGVVQGTTIVEQDRAVARCLLTAGLLRIGVRVRGSTEPREGS